MILSGILHPFLRPRIWCGIFWSTALNRFENTNLRASFFTCLFMMHVHMHYARTNWCGTIRGSIFLLQTCISHTHQTNVFDLSLRPLGHIFFRNNSISRFFLDLIFTLPQIMKILDELATESTVSMYFILWDGVCIFYQYYYRHSWFVETRLFQRPSRLCG